MHYYAHNINDFNNATIHLSVEEECMYHRALAWYYSNEKPLPNDKAKIYRFLRATTKKLQTAVNNILDDFFTEESDGFHQSRCDSEIVEYKGKQAKAVEAGKASAEARRKLTPVKANVEHDNNDISADVQQESNDRSTTVQPTNNHKPITNNHKPNTQTPPNPQEQKSGVCEGQTAVEVLAKAEQIRQANAQDIQDWIAPSLNEMLDMLKLSGFNGGLTEQQYQVSTSDMKTHFTEQAISGKPIKTDSLRKQKLRDWIMRNANKPLAGKSKPTNESRFGTANDPLAVNQVWGQKLSYTATQTYEDYMAEQEDKIARQNPTQSPAGYEEIL